MAERSNSLDGFISRRGATHAIEVRALVERLRSETFGDRNLDVFYDEDDADRGSLVAELEYGLEHSRHLVVCMTQAYFMSPTGWTDAEWHSFLHTDPDGRSDRVIPVLLEECDVPMLLKQLKMVILTPPTSPSQRARYEREYANLVSRLKDEPRRRERRHGQAFDDERIDHMTLAAERARSQAAPDPTTEVLRVNLLHATQVPSRIWAMPIANRLARPGATLEERFPDGAELQDLARTRLEELKIERPYVPGFRRHGRRIVTFDEPRNDHPLQTIADMSEAREYPVADWLNDEDERRIVVELWNKALRSYANRLGLVSTREEPHRFFHERLPGQDERLVNWRGRGKGRIVVKAYRDEASGELNFWFHRAADVRVRMLGRRTYLRIRPTVVFTRDGTAKTVRTGRPVTALARPFTQKDRNANVEYLVLFWAWVLSAGGHRLVSIPVSQQQLTFDARLVGIELPVGIAFDQSPISERLDADDELEDDERSEDMEGDDADADA